MITTFSVLVLTGCSDSNLWAESTGAPPVQDTDTPPPELDTGDWGDSGDTGDFESGPWTGQWGEIDQGSGGAWTGFVEWDGATAACDLEYALTPAGAAQGCPGCAMAMSFTLGAPEVFENVGGRCEQLGWTGLQGTTLTVGHSDPETLMQLANGTWNATGWSAVQGTMWQFEIEL